MDSEEFTHWLAFERLEPWGGLQEDFRAGQITAAVVNMNRAPSTEPVSASDYFPSLAREVKKARPEPLPIDDKHMALFDACIFGVVH